MDILKLSSLTPDAVQRMSYNEIIGLVRETNRPPGGRATVSQVLRNTAVHPGSRVLDIGCSTGFTSLEIAGQIGCETIGIDINPTSLEEARARAKAVGANSVRFDLGDVRSLPYENNSFDLVFCGNVTSIIEDADAALAEYRRVLRPYGMLAAVPIYYVIPPDRDLVEAVREAIHVNFDVKYRREAMEFFDRPELILMEAFDWQFTQVSAETVSAFCRRVLEQPHLEELKNETRVVLKEKYARLMELFRINLGHMGYTVLLLRKALQNDEGELFFGEPVGVEPASRRRAIGNPCFTSERTI